MKRSEMVKLMADTLKKSFDGNNGSWEADAENLLNVMEDSGILPPQHPNKEFNTEELSPTGNIIYGRKIFNEWEEE